MEPLNPAFFKGSPNSAILAKIQCAGDLNQKKLRYVNGCTHFSLLFVEWVAKDGTQQMNGNSLKQLLEDSGVLDLQGARPFKWQEENGKLVPPENNFNGAPEEILSQTRVLKKSEESYVIMPAFNQYACDLAERILELFDKRNEKGLVGALLMDGTQTFAIAFPESGGLVFFDPHGDSAQNAPAYCLVLEREKLKEYIVTMWNQYNWSTYDQLDVTGIEKGAVFKIEKKPEVQASTYAHKLALLILLGVVAGGAAIYHRHGTLSPIKIWKEKPSPQQKV